MKEQVICYVTSSDLHGKLNKLNICVYFISFMQTVCICLVSPQFPPEMKQASMLTKTN